MQDLPLPSCLVARLVTLRLYLSLAIIMYLSPRNVGKHCFRILIVVSLENDSIETFISSSLAVNDYTSQSV